MRNILLLVALIGGCASQPAKVSNTHWPEAVVPAPRAGVQQFMLGRMASAGGEIISASESMIRARYADS